MHLNSFFYSEALHAVNLTLDKIGSRVPLYEVQVDPWIKTSGGILQKKKLEKIIILLAASNASLNI